MNEYMVFTDDRCPNSVIRWAIGDTVIPQHPNDGFDDGKTHYVLTFDKSLSPADIKRFLAAFFDEMAKHFENEAAEKKGN